MPSVHRNYRTMIFHDFSTPQKSKNRSPWGAFWAFFSVSTIISAWQCFGVHRDLARHPTDFRNMYPALYLRNFSRRIDFWRLELSEIDSTRKIVRDIVWFAIFVRAKELSERLIQKKSGCKHMRASERRIVLLKKITAISLRRMQTRGRAIPQNDRLFLSSPESTTWFLYRSEMSHLE